MASRSDSPPLLPFLHGTHVLLSDVPVLSVREWRTAVIESVADGRRIAALFGHPVAGDRVRLFAVLADGENAMVEVGAADADRAYPALTPDCPQAHLFEREIFEQWTVRPEGHPWLKPVRFHGAWREDAPTAGTDARATIRSSVMDFFRVEGDEVHEVAVGPVHAGVIEPGHFRFQCHGETVFHLEISLGYQHRGVERSLIGGPGKRTPHVMETIAGDTSIGHAMSYAHLLENLAGAPVPARAQVLRGVALELERLANHVGDLGALAGDVGYLPTASFCGRIRGEFLNMTALLAGNRFGRGLIRPGGVAFDMTGDQAPRLLEWLDRAERDFMEAADLLWDSPSVTARFEETGILNAENAVALGLVGPAARAAGLERDARFEFPSGIHRLMQIPVSMAGTGDVLARALVRRLEAGRSIAFIREAIRALPEGSASAPIGRAAPYSLAVSAVEGWRGEIWHVALTGDDGKFARYKVVDPSFHNWMGLALAMRGQDISDFPLCNKSSNLSYCGHDQ